MTHRMKIVLNFTLALLLILTCLLALPAPGMAHVASRDYSWSTALPVKEEPEASAELLRYEGNHVMLSYLESSRTVEIPLSVPESFYWCVTVTSDVPGLSAYMGFIPTEMNHITVGDLGMTQVYKGTSQNMALQLYNELPPLAEGEVIAEGRPVAGTVTVTLTMVTIPETVQIAETVIPPEETSSEPAETEVVEEPIDEPVTPTLPVATVVGTKTAVFHVPLVPYSTVAPGGELAECPTQYHPDAAFVAVNGDQDLELTLLDTGFPANTNYEINGEHYLLYDGGAITLPANATIVLDLSRAAQITAEEETPEMPEGEPNVMEPSTEENLPESQETPAEPGTEGAIQTVPIEGTDTAQEPARTLTLIAGGFERKLHYAEVPSVDETSGPMIMTDGAMILPLTYRWNGLVPIIAVERLQREDGILTWVNEETQWNIAEAGTGMIVSTPGKVVPGTYRLSAVWNKDDTELYRVEVPIYVRNSLAG